MDSSAVTVCIPSIPTRQDLLDRALASVAAQTLQPAEVIVETDAGRTGAAATRQRALARVTTPLVAFLDDDDELWPRHLELCVRELSRSAADLVYPWFEVAGGDDPFPDRYRQPFDADLLRARGSSFVPITVVARTLCVRAAGGFRENPTPEGWTNEDWTLWMAMIDNSARFVHLPRRTWTWHHHGSNTSGNAKNW